LKTASIVIGTFITFYTMGCSQQQTSIEASTKKMKINLETPQTYEHIPSCFTVTKEARSLCLNKIFRNNDEVKLLIHPQEGEVIKLAGRGQSVQKRTFNIKDDTRILLYIETSNLKMPLSCNVVSAKLTENKKRDKVVVDIAIKDIKEHIQLRDKEGKLLLDYSIISKQ